MVGARETVRSNKDGPQTRACPDRAPVQGTAHTLPDATASAATEGPETMIPGRTRCKIPGEEARRELEERGEIRGP